MYRHEADAVRGVLYGTAIGDALGLPWEGLSAAKIARIAPAQLDYSEFNRAYLSDDTEHTVLVAAAVAGAHGDVHRFRDHLARGLRRWLWSFPPGIGFGTLRSLVRLSFGVDPMRSGVNSAGNGAAMRAALLGVTVPEDELREWVLVSSRITHADPRAIEGAYVVAFAANLGSRVGHEGKLDAAHALLDVVTAPDLHANLLMAIDGARVGQSPEALADAMGISGFVTGFVNHTVPIAISLWLAHDGYRDTVEAAVRLGGDTDTVAAIAGALCGATSGAKGIPRELRDGLNDWPLDSAGLEAATVGLLERQPGSVPRVGGARALIRNLCVLPRFVAHLITRAMR